MRTGRKKLAYGRRAASRIVPPLQMLVVRFRIGLVGRIAVCGDGRQAAEGRSALDAGRKSTTVAAIPYERLDRLQATSESLARESPHRHAFALPASTRKGEAVSPMAGACRARLLVRSVPSRRRRETRV